MADPLRLSSLLNPVRPDASRVSKTPRPTPGLLDLLRQAMEHVDRRVGEGIPANALLGMVPDYISGPRGAVKSTGFLRRPHYSDEAINNYMAKTAGTTQSMQAFTPGSGPPIIQKNVLPGYDLVGSGGKMGGEFYVIRHAPSTANQFGYKSMPKDEVHGVLKVDRTNGADAVIRNLAVRPEIQGRGLSQRLLSAAEAAGLPITAKSAGTDVSDAGAAALNKYLRSKTR